MTVPRTIRLREGEQPGAPYEVFEPGTELGPLEFSIDAGTADAYMDLHGCDRDWYLTHGKASKMLVPPMVLGLYLLPILYQRYPPLQGIVLTRQRFSFLQPLHAGEPMVASGHVIEKYERRGRRFVRWSATFRFHSGDLAAEAENTFMLPAEHVKEQG